MLRDEEMEEELLPFEGIDKAAVLQECREFSAVTIKVDKCLTTMTKVLYLVSTGVSLSPIEATDVFFGATKLFQCDHPKLRRVLFVLLKELSTVAEQVFIASSSLVKDITGNSDVNRCNALRTLRKVTDTTMIGPMERYLKQAVVDKSNSVVSAAIVTGIHLAHTQPDMVRRWVTEVSEALKSRGNKVQYHALALLHKLRKNDRMSVIKLVQQATSGPIRSPLALCLLIKMSAECMQEDMAASTDLYKFVCSMTHHGHDIVVFEAAKALCSLRNITAKEIQPAVLVLQLYLTSHKPSLRFAAVRLLNRVATNHPSAVAPCAIDLESLISDPNRNIATLAITTLLKTGTEFNVDRLMRQIGGFMADLADEFKIVVIDSLKIMAVKFPQKYEALLSFLSDALEADGGADFKRAVVETMVSILHSNPAARDSTLTHLCEFIEDCEYNLLVQRVLFLLGQQGPLASNPKKFVRCIYNRITLESPNIRAVAVSTLAKFAAQIPSLRPQLTVLFKRTMLDSDDEVRDRATFYYHLFARNDEVAIRSLVSDVSAAVTKERESLALTKPAAAGFVDVAAPEIELQGEAVKEAAAAAAASGSSSSGAVGGVDQLSAVVMQLRDKLKKVPQIKELGVPLRTCEALPLTEADNEYVVSVIKQIYADHIVFQFKVHNTMDDKSLRKLNILTDTEQLEGAEPIFAVPIDTIGAGQTEYGYVVLRYEENSFPAGSVTCAFTFAIQEDGDDEPGEEDEYPLDEFTVNVCDYINPLDLGSGYDRQWDQLAGEEQVDTYNLATMKNLTQAAKEFIDFYGMHVQGGPIDKITTKSHIISMSGTLANTPRSLVLIRGKVFITTESTVALQLTIRGASEELRQFLSAALVS